MTGNTAQTQNSHIYSHIYLSTEHTADPERSTCSYVLLASEKGFKLHTGNKMAYSIAGADEKCNPPTED